MNADWKSIPSCRLSVASSNEFKLHKPPAKLEILRAKKPALQDDKTE